MSTREKFPILSQTHRGEALQHDMNKRWSGHHNVAALIANFEEELKSHTIFMAEHGISHRKNDPLQVGAVIVGLVASSAYNTNRPERPYRGTRIVVLEGYNMSPYRGVAKDCAELRALRMGDDVVVGPGIESGKYRLLHDPLRPWQALSMTVASSGSADINKEVNGLEAPTLHCCMTPCQDVLENHPATSPDLDIVSITFDSDARTIVAEEKFTLDSLRAVYSGIQPPAVSRELQTRQSS
jgi:hypothetical protein